MANGDIKACDAYRDAMAEMEPRERALLALDDMTHAQSAELLGEIDGMVGKVKENANADSLGYADSVSRNAALGYELMADPKYNDTPRTMKSHILSTAGDGAHFITMHVSSGRKSLAAAVEGRDLIRSQARGQAEMEGTEFNTRLGSLLGITVLTSIDDAECIEIFGAPTREKVMQFALTAYDADLEGIVCAGENLEDLMANPMTRRLIKVVPGIILPGDPIPSGQERVMIPSEAIEAGADFVVFGSAITKKQDRLAAARIGVEQIALGMGV